MEEEIDTQKLEYSIDFSFLEKKNNSTERFNNVLDTQELTYSVELSFSDHETDSSDEDNSIRDKESSSSNENDDSTSEGDESIPDLSVLNPYDFEPIIAFNEIENEEGESNSKSTDIPTRIGNVNWCKCGYCKPMESEAESLCCLDTNQIPDENFEGNNCVTLSEGFSTVCLSGDVLRTALSALNNLRGDIIKPEITNCAFRYAGYKQFTWWIHNYLGKGVRKVIPSCAVWAIRTKYPSKGNKYIPFMEYKEEERRLLEEN